MSFPPRQFVFFPTSVTSDGKKLLAFAVQPNQNNPPHAKPSSAGWIDVSTGHYTAVSLPGGIPFEELDHLMSSTSQPVIVNQLETNVEQSAPNIRGFNANIVLIGDMGSPGCELFAWATRNAYSLCTIVQYYSGGAAQGFGVAELPFEADVYKSNP